MPVCGEYMVSVCDACMRCLYVVPQFSTSMGTYMGASRVRLNGDSMVPVCGGFMKGVSSGASRWCL